MIANRRIGAVSSRTRRLLVALGCVGALLTGCSDDHGGPDARQAQVFMNGLGGRGTALRPGTDTNALYADAMALKAKGDCANAIPKLRQIAGLGPGYEGAQTALGECLLRGAGNADLSSDYLEGLTWLRRAADAGWPEAQGRLAYAHAVGPTTIRNAEEAGYWLALYQTNPGKSRVGFTPFPADQLASVDAAIPAAAKAAGAKRAESWERKVWMPPSTPPAQGPSSHRMDRREGMSRDDGAYPPQ